MFSSDFNDITEKTVDESLVETQKVYSKFTIKDFLLSSSDMDEDIWEEQFEESIDTVENRQKLVKPIRSKESS